MEFGVALYRRPGALDRIGRSTDHRAAAREDALAVTLDDEPTFAITALREAYGLARLPVPMKMHGDGARAITVDEVAILGGVLRLLAGVTEPAGGLDGDRTSRRGELDLDALRKLTGVAVSSLVGILAEQDADA